jgi:hypothetical protein
MTCFDDVGNEITCQDSGQNGEYNLEKYHPADRFGIENNLIADRWTGLLWHPNANLAQFPMTWNETHHFIAVLNSTSASGTIGWRLPTRAELFSIISHHNINPALPAHHPFENVFNGYYWTQTACARLPNQKWYVHLGGGRVYRGMRHGSYLLWPVAGAIVEKSVGQDRFEVSKDAFRDRFTQKCWLGWHPLYEQPLTWKEALESIKDLNDQEVAGCHTWRLPNIRELESLVDLRKHSPSIALGHGFTSIQEGYWSSTTSAYEPSYAWVLYTKDGAVGVGYKHQAIFYMIAVTDALSSM